VTSRRNPRAASMHTECARNHMYGARMAVAAGRWRRPWPWPWRPARPLVPSSPHPLIPTSPPWCCFERE
jgi:hypothetical protein